MRGRVFGNLIGKVIRTYNYKRGTVKDERTGLVLPLRDVMDGDIERFTSQARVPPTLPADRRPNAEGLTPK